MYVIEITQTGFLQMPVERKDGKIYFLNGKRYNPDPTALYKTITNTPLSFDELKKLKDDYTK